MLKSNNSIRNLLSMLSLLLILVTACNSVTPSPETPLPATPTLTETPAQPSATPVPAAAIVNGEVIPLTWFESELSRYLQAQDLIGNSSSDEEAARETVLQDLIHQFLLAQAAREAGVEVTDEEVQKRMNALAEDVDLNAWMTTWGYTTEELHEFLKLQILAAWQRNEIIGSIPEVQEQVKLQQIFAYTEAGAKKAMVSLNSGKSFEEVAYLFDPITGGYLGWVPRGYLLIPAVEEAAFNLPVGTYSEVIESDIGYHIVLVLDREERSLTADARLTLQRQALHAWINDRYATSEIEFVID